MTTENKLVGNFVKPDWAPSIPQGSRILVAGASGGIGRHLVDMLHKGSRCVIGAHGATKPCPIEGEDIFHLRSDLKEPKACIELVERFVEHAGGIDGLVVLSGGLETHKHWRSQTPDEWEQEIDSHLNRPMHLSKAAMDAMSTQKTGGRIVLNGTESALHGGSPTALSYAVAKRGIECLVQGLARDGAADGILVNGVRLGFIDSGFHKRWQEKSAKELRQRADMVPLKRAGHPDEAAALIAYLLSGWASFITGQMIPLTGGDWL